MKGYTIISIYLLILFSGISGAICQEKSNNVKNFQIYLKKPAQSILLLMYEKNFKPIQGELSKDKKSVIIKNYEQGSKVRVKVKYEDGTIDEFVKSPCYIDPVIT